MYSRPVAVPGGTWCFGSATLPLEVSAEPLRDASNPEMSREKRSEVLRPGRWERHMVF